MKRSVKKILSAMFVGCMLLSTTVMGAGAIDLNDNSKFVPFGYNGESGTVLVQQPDGSFSSEDFDYIVPYSADADAENEQAFLAAYEAAFGVEPRKTQYLTSQLVGDIPENTGDYSYFEIVASRGNELDFDAEKVAVTFTEVDSSLTSLNAALVNRSVSFNDQTYQMRIPLRGDTVVAFMNGEYYEGNAPAKFKAGDRVGMRLSGNRCSGRAYMRLWASN